MLVLAALVGLQAFFAMTVIYLFFLALESERGGGELNLGVVMSDIPLSQRVPRMLQGKAKSVRWRRSKQR
jgi:hypothetical protein